jgi:8-amino-3,8-dideoxy-alpha-D-manno-octulosonate transaminase
LIALQHTDFSKSDAVMSKCISTAMSLVWTEEQVHEKGAAFLAVLKKVVA